MSIQEFVKPEVGQGVTQNHPQDAYPFRIVAVSESGKTITIVPVHTVSLATGHVPARYDGPFPVWSHRYTAEELVSLAYTPEEIVAYEDARQYTGETFEKKIRYGKKGWSYGGSRYTVGDAWYHRNYSY